MGPVVPVAPVGPVGPVGPVEPVSPCIPIAPSVFTSQNDAVIVPETSKILIDIRPVPILYEIIFPLK
jgi:hypothetical protein